MASFLVICVYNTTDSTFYTFRSRRWKQYVHPKLWYPPTRLHDVWSMNLQSDCAMQCEAHSVPDRTVCRCVDQTTTGTAVRTYSLTIRATPVFIYGPCFFSTVWLRLTRWIMLSSLKWREYGLLTRRDQGAACSKHDATVPRSVLSQVPTNNLY